MSLLITFSYVDNKEYSITDLVYFDLIYNIRQTMQISQAQFEIMNEAVDKCSKISKENLPECMVAIDIAHKEILRFLEINVKLAKLVNDLRNYVIAKKM